MFPIIPAITMPVLDQLAPLLVCLCAHVSDGIVWCNMCGVICVGCVYVYVYVCGCVMMYGCGVRVFILFTFCDCYRYTKSGN